MKIDFQSLEQGFEAGVERTNERFGIDLVQVRQLSQRLINVLGTSPEQAHPRFITLFAELWVVAEVARLANGEPRLTQQEIQTFLEHSFAYFNSFKHK